MASAALVETVIYDQSLYRPTGMVGKWMRKLTLRMELEIKKAAPKRTGFMASAIYANVRNTGAKIIEGIIASPAPYTLYVIHGTGFPVKGAAGRIYTTKGFRTRNEDDAYVVLWGVKPRGGKFTRFGRGDGTFEGARRQHRVRKRGYWLKLPFPSRTGAPFTLTFSVRGQEPNNFMEVGWRRTARNHKVLRGSPFPRF